MKLNLKTICLGAFASCTLAACDLDTTPTTSLDTSAVFQSTDNADAVLRGVWYYMFNSGSTYASVGLNSLLINDDFGGSDVVRARSYGFSSSYSLTNGFSRGEYNGVMWDIMYTAINNCNAVIANIDHVEGDGSEKNRIKGQALATRGYAYMMLASHYSFSIEKDPDAVCVPIWLEPSDYDSALHGIPASSVSEVYAQALSDLKDALDYIPETYSHGNTSTDQYKIDHLVTLGLLARTSLYAARWQDAYDYADAALAINSYIMTEDEFNGGFNDYTNGEWMWGLSPTLDDNLPAYTFYFKDTTTPGASYTSLCADPNFVNTAFEEGDYRKDMYRFGYTQQGQEYKMLCTKFRSADVENQMADILLMRTSEMYLIKMEAAAHLSGKESEAQTMLQEFRQHRMKSGYTAAPVTATGDDLLAEIWLERRKELWGEGFSLTDIIRTQQSVSRQQYMTQQYDNDGNPMYDKDGKPLEVNAGHTTLSLPDDTPFVANSIYYLFRIPEQEELQNPDLYSRYPKSDLY